MLKLSTRTHSRLFWDTMS